MVRALNVLNVVEHTELIQGLGGSIFKKWVNILVYFRQTLTARKNNSPKVDSMSCHRMFYHGKLTELQLPETTPISCLVFSLIFSRPCHWWCNSCSLCSLTQVDVALPSLKEKSDLWHSPDSPPQAAGLDWLGYLVWGVFEHMSSKFDDISPRTAQTHPPKLIVLLLDSFLGDVTEFQWHIPENCLKKSLWSSGGWVREV